MTLICPASVGLSRLVQTQQQIDWYVNERQEFTPDLAIDGCTVAIPDKQLACTFPYYDKKAYDPRSGLKWFDPSRSARCVRIQKSQPRGVELDPRNPDDSLSPNKHKRLVP